MVICDVRVCTGIRSMKKYLHESVFVLQYSLEGVEQFVWVDGRGVDLFLDVGQVAVGIGRGHVHQRLQVRQLLAQLNHLQSPAHVQRQCEPVNQTNLSTFQNTASKNSFKNKQLLHVDRDARSNLLYETTPTKNEIKRVEFGLKKHLDTRNVFTPPFLDKINVPH